MRHANEREVSSCIKKGQLIPLELSLYNSPDPNLADYCALLDVCT